MILNHNFSIDIINCKYKYVNNVKYYLLFFILYIFLNIT